MERQNNNNIAVIAGLVLLIAVIPITEERLRKKRFG
jgi:hypothetical protein